MQNDRYTDIIEMTGILYGDGPTTAHISHKVGTVIGDCDNRTQGPDDYVLEGRDYMTRTCPQCGAHAEPLVRNDARCTCWRWLLSCPECGQQWHD